MPANTPASTTSTGRLTFQLFSNIPINSNSIADLDLPGKEKPSNNHYFSLQITLNPPQNKSTSHPEIKELRFHNTSDSASNSGDNAGISTIIVRKNRKENNHDLITDVDGFDWSIGSK